jgi:hypothetical protein
MRAHFTPMDATSARARLAGTCEMARQCGRCAGLTDPLQRRMSPRSPAAARDVAEVFNCTDRTIRNWVKKGWLVQHCVGKSVFYRRVDVERLAGLSPE